MNRIKRKNMGQRVASGGRGNRQTRQRRRVSAQQQNQNKNKDTNEEKSNTNTEKLPNTKNGCSKDQRRRSDQDGPPDDINAFFGHPLTAATTAINGEDTSASAAALLHEYNHLPAIDKKNNKAKTDVEKPEEAEEDQDFESIHTDPKIEEGAVIVVPANENESDYMELLHFQHVEKFLNAESELSDSGKDSKCCSDEEDEVGMKIDITQQECKDEKLPIISSEDIVIETSPDIVDMRTEIPLSASPTSPSTQSPLPYHSAAGNSITSPCNSVSQTDYSATSLAPGSMDIVYNHESQKLVSEPICSISGNNNETSVTPVSETNTSTNFQGNTESVTCAAVANGTAKKISKSTSEKLLKKINQQNTMVHHSNHLCAGGPLGSMNAFGHDGIHMDVKNFSANCKEEQNELLSNCAYLNGNLDAASDIDSNNTVSLPALSSAVSECPVSLSMNDTIVMSMPQIGTISTQPQDVLEHVQTTAYNTYADIPVHSVSPVQLVQNMHHTYQVSQHTPARQHSYPGYYGNSNTSPYLGYQYSDASPTDSTPERESILERYIQQQQTQQYYSEHSTQMYPFGMTGMKENGTYAMKSPDSGFHEPCSPTEAKTLGQKDSNHNFKEALTSTPCNLKVSRRRKSASAAQQFKAGYWPGEKLSFNTVIPKIENNTSGYKYLLDTPISTSVRIEDDRITYLNKGQYYCLNLEFNSDRIPQCQLAKSVIMVVFRDDKTLEDERKAWEFWHSRQHSHKQRVLDIDTKDSQGVSASNISEVAYNAVAVKWNPKESNVKVNIAVHCLSTDFSNQKGVKGFPLHLQIDTFENSKDTYPVHRGYCQIKVFCDKGAERKARDEERRRSRTNKAEAGAPTRKRQEEEVYHPVCERSEFYSMADLQTFPILFTPSIDNDESTKSSPLNGSLEDDGNSSLNSTGDCMDDSMYHPAKRMRRDSYSHYADYPKILLYVREQHETIFNALMLQIPTLQGLLMAIQEKYNIPANQVKSTYKRSKKGILVRMDDNIVRHYSHESTFMIEMNSLNEDRDYEIILTEIDIS